MTCQICGSKKTANETTAVCQHLCYWVLEGWLGWNGKKKLVAMRDQRAMLFVSDKISYPKMVRFARRMGWTGHENAGTMKPLST